MKKKKKRNGIKETTVRGTFDSICANSEKLNAALFSLSWEHVRWATRNFHHSAYGYMCVYVQWVSQVRLFATPWTAARQAPLSMEFSRQEYWSGLPCPSPGDLSNPGTEPISLPYLALADGFFTIGIPMSKWGNLIPVICGYSSTSFLSAIVIKWALNSHRSLTWKTTQLLWDKETSQNKTSCSLQQHIY